MTTFKLYMTYDTQVDDKTIFEILRRLKEVGGITGVHCENSGMIAALQAEAKAEGRMGVSAIRLPARLLRRQRGYRPALAAGRGGRCAGERLWYTLPAGKDMM